MAPACLGRYLQAVAPRDLSGTRRGRSGGEGRHLAPAWELGSEVRVRCQYGSARAVWEQMFCGVFAPAQLRRGRRVYQWLEAFRGATDSDLQAAACQSPPPEALRGPQTPRHLVF